MQRWIVPKQIRKWEAVIEERDRCMDVLKDIEYYSGICLVRVDPLKVRMAELSVWEN